MNAPTPALYRQLADDIAGQIHQGILHAGERLPSLRNMRERTGLSLNTVQEAFRLLEDRGLVDARPQSGFFVRRQSHDAPPPPMQPTTITVDPLLWNYVQDIRLQYEGRLCGFRSVIPPAGLLPVTQLQRLLVDCARRRPDLLADYGSPSGIPELRRQVARHALAWGGQMAPDNLIVTLGTIEALNLALRALTRPGDVVAVESPTYFSLLQCLESLGLRVVEIPTDPATGISVEALELATRDHAVQAVVLVPNFSNPTGALMPDHAKARVAELMSERDIPLIEDDVYGELHFSGPRPRPIKAFDRTGHVLYSSSLTKAVAPGLRIGWIEPGRYRDRVLIQKYITTHSTPSLNQLVLARFMEDGGYQRHLRQFRRRTREQVELVADAVERFFPPGTRFSRPRGGFALWLELPDPAFDSVKLFHAARKEGIGMAPGPLFSARGGYRHALRLSCTAPWDADQARRLARLGELAGQQLLRP